jgi:hypothetical protein
MPIIQYVKDFCPEQRCENGDNPQAPGPIRVNAFAPRQPHYHPQPEKQSHSCHHAISRQRKSAEMKKLGKH